MEHNLSKNNRLLLKLVSLGWRTDGYKVYNSKGVERKVGINSNGYYSYHFSYKKEEALISLHRWVAYYKFGDLIFSKDLEVRHLDGNKLNNSMNNLLMGTRTENSLDIPIEIRKASAIKASKERRVFSDEEVKNIKEDRNKGMSYSELCIKYNTIKSTLSYLFNKALYSNIGG